MFASSMGIERIITLAGGGATTGLAAGATEVLVSSSIIGGVVRSGVGKNILEFKN